MRFWLRYMKFDDELALLERGLSRPGNNALDRRFSFAAGPGDDGGRTCGDQCRHAVGGRRGVAQIAGERGPSLDLLRADQIHALDDARPCTGQRLVFVDYGPRRRRADDEAVTLLADTDHPWDSFGIDDQFGLHPARP